MSSTANRVIKNAGYLYAKMGITMFISLYTTRLILNSLGVSDFGIFNIVGGAIAMLGFLNAAMAGTTQRFMSYTEGEGNKEKQKNIFNVSLILHFIIACLVGIALLIAGLFFFNGILNIPIERIYAAKVVYGSLIISTMFTIMSVPYDATLNAHENMRYYAFVGILESLLKLMVALTCVYTQKDKLITYGALMACIPLITLTIMRVYCHRHYEECTIKIKRYWNKQLMKEMTGFAGWNLFQTGAAIITNNGVSIVMNMFFGPVINAAQGVANQLCGQLLALTNNLVKAINPVIMKTEGQQQHEKVVDFALTGSKATFFMTSLFALPAIIMMPDLLKVWLKNVPDYAVFFAQCQLVIYMCENLSSGLNTAISATGKIRNISISKSIVKFLYLPLSYFLFKLGVSVYIVYILLVLIQGVINGITVPIHFITKYFYLGFITYFKRMLFPCLIITGIVLAIGAGLTLLLDGWLQLIAVFSACIIVNILLFYSLWLTKEERSIAQGVIDKIRRR